MYMYVFTSLDLQKQHEDEKHWQKSWRGYYYTTSIQLFRIFCPKKKFCWEKFFIGVSIFHFYGNVPWKLHLAKNVNTPIQFLSLLNVIKYFSSFSEIFFCHSVCSPSSRTWSLLNGQNLSPMASMSFLDMGAKMLAKIWNILKECSTSTTTQRIIGKTFYRFMTSFQISSFQKSPYYLPTSITSLSVLQWT